MQLAWIIITTLGVHLGLGLLFAGPFILVGVNRIDPLAPHSTWGFRLVILPGVVLLWPLLLWRWMRGAQEPPSERNAHRCGAHQPPAP